MGAWEKLLGFGAAALVLYGVSKIREDNKEQAKRIEESNRRKNTTFHYPREISCEKFEEIVRQSIRPIKKKIQDIYVANGIVYGTVISQSGLSEWSFTLDFNDYGKLTGNFWLTSENHDSHLPERLGNVIQNQINRLLNNTGCDVEDESEEDIETTIDNEDAPIETQQEPLNPQKPSWASRHKGFIFIAILLSIVLTFGSYAYYEYQKLIPIGYEEELLVGLDYNEVMEKLENQGFTYVTTENISDLSLDEETNANLVTDIRLEEKPTFDENTKYSYDKRIVVVYHSLKLCSAPVTSKDAKGTKYTDIMDKFNKVGFVNVKTNVLYDIITGWVTEDGEVKSITINGEEDFDIYDQFRPDAEVIITYHTYKKNNPNK